MQLVCLKRSAAQNVVSIKHTPRDVRSENQHRNSLAQDVFAAKSNHHLSRHIHSRFLLIGANCTRRICTCILAGTLAGGRP